MPRLSKSRFIAGWQCPLRLWFTAHSPELATPPDEGLQRVFAQGHRIGKLAQARYPGGVLVAENHHQTAQALERTADLMSDPAVPAIYEAAIEHRGVLTRVDVLARNGDSWDLVEVKGSTRAKEVFQVDVAAQYWVLQGAGIPVGEAGLLLVNREYVYLGGEYDLQRLFYFAPLTEWCADRQEWVGEQVEQFHGVLEQSVPPDVDIGPHCQSPYACPFWEHCSRDVSWPERPIAWLPNLRGRRQELEARGIHSIDDIPENYPLTAHQERVRASTRTGRPWVSPGLRDALEEVEWPLVALDFEATTTPLPRYPQTRPFDATPFQFSCHVQHHPEGEAVHHEYLHTDSTDPRRPLAEALLAAAGEAGTILVYSGYEQRVIRELADAVPECREALHALLPRLRDLLKVVREHYYHPGFEGAYSIKNVLPTLVPNLQYAELEITDGQAAADAWLEMLDTTDPAQRTAIEAALRRYCQLDSYAMLRLREALLREGDRPGIKL